MIPASNLVVWKKMTTIIFITKSKTTLLFVGSSRWIKDLWRNTINADRKLLFIFTVRLPLRICCGQLLTLFSSMQGGVKQYCQKQKLPYCAKVTQRELEIYIVQVYFLSWLEGSFYWKYLRTFNGSHKVLDIQLYPKKTGTSRMTMSSVFTVPSYFVKDHFSHLWIWYRISLA